MAAAAALLALTACRGDANFAEDANATRDQSPTTAGPPVTGQKFEPGTGGAGAADCDATATCSDTEAKPAEK